MNINISKARDHWTYDIEEDVWRDKGDDVVEYINLIDMNSIGFLEKKLCCNKNKSLLSLTIPELKTTFILPYWKRGRGEAICLHEGRLSK